MQACERCGLPHIYVSGLCPAEAPEAFERALAGWAEYQRRLAERRSR
jgi:hypothetical protein